MNNGYEVVRGTNNNLPTDNIKNFWKIFTCFINPICAGTCPDPPKIDYVCCSGPVNVCGCDTSCFNACLESLPNRPK